MCETNKKRKSRLETVELNKKNFKVQGSCTIFYNIQTKTNAKNQCLLKSVSHINFFQAV